MKRALQFELPSFEYEDFDITFFEKKCQAFASFLHITIVTQTAKLIVAPQESL